MKVQVLFFGATADETGEREIEISLAENSKANGAFAEILEKFPRLAGHKLLFAVNQEYANGEEIIREGDELAVFTAVSGG
ncbi:MAG: MoaD/ThiS family protein [Acidobacteriota bacterium]|nr:MoaD/ThiS family protein [Acidobacteriota bacterium]